MSGTGPTAGNFTQKTSQGLGGNAIPSWSQIISKHERQLMSVLSSAHDSKTMFQGISGVHASIPRV